ncbi:MAG: peptidylprolyl isomerase [Acidiferrobacterales bacterium]
MQITKDKIVTFDYTLKDESGSVIESSRDSDPFSYIHGGNSVIPGLEAALEGKSTGEELTVSLAPAEASGERDESLLQIVPRAQFETNKNLEVGMRFQASTAEGKTRVVTIVKIDNDDITVDTNHPFAGRTVIFVIAIREVRDATRDELAEHQIQG